MSTSASAAAVWDRHARRYGAQEHLEARALATALRLADPRPGETVVDLGTGTGAIPRALARRPAPPASVIGVDRSASMLAEVGPLPAGWSTLVADARAVPLPDGSADLVTCTYLLHLLGPADRRAVLDEARRLLGPAPGGRLVVVTVWADRRRPGGRLASLGLAAAARLAPRHWGGLAPLDPVADLERAGLGCRRRVQLPRGGYPSLVLRAEPRGPAAAGDHAVGGSQPR